MTDLNKIIDACQKGNPKAFEALYNIYAPRLFGICIRYSRTNFEAEDILQESFLRIIKSFPSFSGNPQLLESWLRKIVLYTAIDQFKKNLTFKEHYELTEIAEEVTDISFGELESSLNSEDLIKMINQLPPGYKMVFNLYAIEGFSHSEIAGILSISEGTSKSQLAKARKFLKRLLTENKIIENGIKS